MKKTNKLISILIVFAMLLSIVPMNLSVSAAPDTDYNGYYKITNAGNLAWFACLVVGDTSQSGITEAVPDAKAVLTADIDITVLAERLGKSWVGIGTAEIPFTGVFDGNGYTIKGLTTDTDLTKSAVATVPVDTEKQGLFGVIGKGGVVRDVIVEGTANLSDTIKYGGICSENNGTIENVLSMVTVTGGDNADIFCHTNNGTITNSFANQNSMATDVTLVTTEELADGSVTYALGDSFGQTIGTDTQPVHYDGTNRVYEDGDAYTNTAPVYAASVTDANGNELEGSPYKTFAEAVTAAEANENSTLTLLDNITLTDTQWISSGKFTLDLSGKTLLCESAAVLLIKSGADLTIKDSGKNGLIETKITNGSAIRNVGALTFESGMVKSGENAINNSGKLQVNNGIFEGKYSIYTSSGFSTEINDGTFNGIVWGFSGYTINGGNFTGDHVGINCQGETLTINGGTFDINKIEIYQGTVELKGGKFTRGFTLYDEEYDNDEPHYLNDILADGCYFYDADGKKITVAEDATSIEGYVQVKEYFAASVTDAEGKLIGNYKTFAEAVTAAEANENSTLTLLDNITLTDTQYISSGKFTLDMSGKTLIYESNTVLQIMPGADLTIKDSGKNGLIETKTTDGAAIRNRGGTLTFESGMVKSGRYAINNSGKLKVNNGIFEGEYSIYISSDSSTEINDGTFNGDVWGFSGYTINDGNFTSDYVGINCQGETLTINGGTFDIDEIKIFRGTVELKGGQFTRGFTLNDYEYDDDETHYLNDILADGYYYRNAGGYLMTFNDDASVIDEPVHIRRGAKLVTQAEITLAQTEFEFTGEEIRPEVTVKIAGITLEDKDIIELVYNNNVNAGTGTVTVSSSDPYFEGEVTLEFTITPKVVDTIWSETTEFDYDGNAHSVTATYVDVNGETVNAVVANGTNTEVGRYTAVATIEDTNYVIKNETAKCQYIIKGDIDLTGTVVSFGDETDEVTLRLYKDGDEENAYVVTVTGNSAEYTFEGIANGTYILEVSKLNHVTRTYEVVVSEEDVTQDVKIHLRGDINGDGKLNSIDVARANSNARGMSALTGYELSCSDVNGDGKANSIDVARMNAHVRGTTLLW